jgi:hypothetical protein
MKMRLTLAATAFLAALTLPTTALAKGASEASITGPGLKGGGIHLKGGRGDPAPGTALGDLTNSAGYFPAMFGQQPDPMLDRRPAGTLGPKYSIAWIVPGPGEPATIHQDLYPYAKPAPVTYMPPGQTFFGHEKTRGGWFVSSPSLKATLVDAGLPATAPARNASSGFSFSWNLAGASAAALALLGAAFLAVRIRGRGARS